ncbi:hypothetical protein C5167_016411 [Papaver somniferum]|uniref:uncharacterized protein LOC113333491 n=1 Tax=Papaver somniferum TaxID=3469 RepID=UPI000E6F52E2|nr:uncharacterized protein LOC113333491 [Papaver somniferum]XP_026435731.1 uncharacterized protein LOC113333491 [Papaver somniferum]RZC88549.1 hypothetical protein C5167_016411 [Papaver somniferum]
MPTFSAVTLDRFLESGAAKSKLKSQVSPSLYKTRETTSSLPESPFSLPPSTYVVNHKRRGVNLQKSHSQSEVLERAVEDKIEDRRYGLLQVQATHSLGDVSVLEITNKLTDISEEVDEIGGKTSNLNDESGEENDVSGERKSSWNDVNREKRALLVANGNELDKEIVSDDFFDPQESMSYTSNTDAEDNAWGERSFKMSTMTAEYYDACEELSSAGSLQSSMRDLDSEVREIRVNLLLEIERRKRAEDTFNSMERQWESLREKLSAVGVILSSASAIVMEDGGLKSDIAEDVCHQVSVARFVADAVGRGVAKAEVEKEMESLVESKNFEIARLIDRLHYYETMNSEMSNRNQEAMENARHDRQRRKRRQRWIWSSIGVTIALGSAALAWSYYQPTSKGVLPSSSSHSTEIPKATKL